jgi:predicted TIM-barrel fold metal-dependent hydrolase
VKFILLHSSYPYGGELAVLAKNFPNVYIDMAWTPIISPSYSIRYLQEFLETVPVNKIMVFGGDGSYVEGAYGASIMAREVVEKTLIAMIKSGYFNEEEAISIVPKLLRTNAIKVYDLKGL